MLIEERSQPRDHRHERRQAGPRTKSTTVAAPGRKNKPGLSRKHTNSEFYKRRCVGDVGISCTTGRGGGWEAGAKLREWI